MEILSHASVKKKTKRLKGFNFHTFYGWFSNDIMAVEGLRERIWIKLKLNEDEWAGKVEIRKRKKSLAVGECSEALQSSTG